MWLYHRVMSPNDADGMANSVDPDQTAPLGAVWSGSALFAQAYLSKNLGSLWYAVCHCSRLCSWCSSKCIVSEYLLPNFWGFSVCFCNSSHLSPLTSEVVGAPQMTLQQYLSTLSYLPLPSGNLQTPFPSIPWCYLPISSVFLSFLLLSLFPAELSSPCPRILRCVWVSISLPWLGDHHALQLHFGFCCKPPHLSHGLCRKCSEVSYSISSQGLGSFSRFLLSRSSSHRHKGR